MLESKVFIIQVTVESISHDIEAAKMHYSIMLYCFDTFINFKMLFWFHALLKLLTFSLFLSSPSGGRFVVIRNSVQMILTTYRMRSIASKSFVRSLRNDRKLQLSREFSPFPYQ